MARRSCVNFLRSAMRECQDDVNFTLKPLFQGKHFRKPVNKGLQKLNAHHSGERSRPDPYFIGIPRENLRRRVAIRNAHKEEA